MRFLNLVFLLLRESIPVVRVPSRVAELCNFDVAPTILCWSIIELRIPGVASNEMLRLSGVAGTRKILKI